MRLFMFSASRFYVREMLSSQNIEKPPKGGFGFEASD
jgi:hypothetical protein